MRRGRGSMRGVVLVGRWHCSACGMPLRLRILSRGALGPIDMPETKCCAAPAIADDEAAMIYASDVEFNRRLARETGDERLN